MAKTPCARTSGCTVDLITGAWLRLMLPLGTLYAAQAGWCAPMPNSLSKYQQNSKRQRPSSLLRPLSSARQLASLACIVLSLAPAVALASLFTRDLHWAVASVVAWDAAFLLGNDA